MATQPDPPIHLPRLLGAVYAIPGLVDFVDGDILLSLVDTLAEDGIEVELCECRFDTRLSQERGGEPSEREYFLGINGQYVDPDGLAARFDHDGQLLGRDGQAWPNQTWNTGKNARRYLKRLDHEVCAAIQACILHEKAQVSAEHMDQGTPPANHLRGSVRL